jgi:SAM-dependent methyltransferase
MNEIIKINLGAGNDIFDGYVNHDIAQLPGINVTHNLNEYPWPWASDSVTEIHAKDVIEHLDDFIAVMEEMHRILKVGGIAFIKVPYWNSWSAHVDPTHKRGFHELTFHFLDLNSPWRRERPYYTKSNFSIARQTFVLIPFSPYFSLPLINRIRINNKIMQKILSLIGNIFSGIIIDLEFKLIKVDSTIK